jgi:SAM-dependent methyltransferase
MLRSIVCRYEHFQSDWYRRWAVKLPLAHYGIDPSTDPKRPHRKAWEWCAIAQGLSERGMLEAGRKGCGFAVGREPLAPLFASLGADILATDLAPSSEATPWADTGQHAASLEAIYRPEILDRESFHSRVRFRPADMRRLDLWGEERNFDFLWSACSIEHLGSLDAGMTFVAESARLLRPGGWAAHTTEFNVSSDSDTVETGDSVLYRERDIRALDRRLRAIGCGLCRCDFFAGDAPEDLDFDLPPYGLAERQHVKLLLSGFVCTSMLLIVRRGNVVGPMEHHGANGI